MISFSIPGRPKPKERPRIGNVGGHAIAYTPPQTRNEEAAVRLFAAAAMAGRPPMEGPLELYIVFSLPIPDSWSEKKKNDARNGIIMHTKRPDATNATKLYEDGMNCIVWKDDSQIVRVIAEKQYSDQPRVDIQVRHLNRLRD